MNRNNNVIITVILSFTFIFLYYLLNNIFIEKMNQIVNYIFLLVIFAIIFNVINKVLNDNYINFNRKYLSLLNRLRLLTNYLNFKDGQRLSYLYLNDNIKEGNNYIEKNKSIFISTNVGIILLVTLIWHLIINSNSTLLNGIMLPIIIVVIVILLFILPVLLSLLYTAKLINKIENNQEKKVEIKTEKIILSFEIIILLISDIIFFKKIEIKELFWLNVAVIMIITLLYKPIKIACIKCRRRKANQ